MAMASRDWDSLWVSACFLLLVRHWFTPLTRQEPYSYHRAAILVQGHDFVAFFQ